MLSISHKTVNKNGNTIYIVSTIRVGNGFRKIMVAKAPLLSNKIGSV